MGAAVVPDQGYLPNWEAARERLGQARRSLAPLGRQVAAFSNWTAQRLVYSVTVVSAQVLMHWHPSWSATVFFASAIFSEELRQVIERVEAALLAARWYEWIGLLALLAWNYQHVTPFLACTYTAMRLACHLSTDDASQTCFQLSQNQWNHLTRDAEELQYPPNGHLGHAAERQIERLRQRALPGLRGMGEWCHRQNHNYRIVERLQTVSEIMSFWAQRIAALALFRLNPPLTGLTTVFTLAISVNYPGSIRSCVDRITRVWTHNNPIWCFCVLTHLVLMAQISPVLLGIYAAARFGCHLAERISPIVPGEGGDQVVGAH